MLPFLKIRSAGATFPGADENSRAERMATRKAAKAFILFLAIRARKMFCRSSVLYHLLRETVRARLCLDYNHVAQTSLLLSRSRHENGDTQLEPSQGRHPRVRRSSGKRAHGCCLTHPGMVGH